MIFNLKYSAFLVVFFTLLGFRTLSAQKGYEVGAHVGTATYFGDLNTNLNIGNPGIAIGLQTRRNLNDRISLAAGLTFGQISAHDENSNNFYERTRNLSFKSNVFDLNFALEFNFFKYVHGSSDYFYTPYIFGGLSFMSYNPKTEIDGTTYNLRDYATEGQFDSQEYGLITPAFVFGFGFKWDINRDWSLNTTLSGRNVFSDYIDDVSGTYPDFAAQESRRGEIGVLLSNPSLDPDFAVPGQQRGNGKSNDMVYFFTIGIMRYFGQIECPAITKNLY